MENWARVAGYAFLAALVSALQFGVFDCNELPVVSFLGGFVTLVGACLITEGVYRASRSPRPRSARLGRAIGLGVLGLALVVALGWFTVMTHLCG